MAAIRIEGLTKHYAARPGEKTAPAALEGLDLDIADGELLVLVGPSGCGKSTALRLIAGLEVPSAGRVHLGDRDLGGVPPQHRDVAMVFQGYALYPHLTVAENMAFPLEMRGMAKAERRQRVAEIAALVGLGDKLGRLPSELSGGERQRVAMGRAIVRSPRAFLFDEPLSNLDAKLRAELRVELVSLVRRLGTTSIYVTHDQSEAMTMADRVAVLSGGRLQQVAPPRQIYEDPDNAFVASFVGTPEMNLLTLEQVDGVARGQAGAIALPDWLEAGPRVTVGFRPEHVDLGEPGRGASEPHRGRGERSSAATLEAKVRAVEPLGPETLVYLEAGDEPLRARIPGFGGPEVGSTATLTVAAAHLFWFDAEDGRRLRPRGEGAR